MRELPEWYVFQAGDFIRCYFGPLQRVYRRVSGLQYQHAKLVCGLQCRRAKSFFVQWPRSNKLHTVSSPAPGQCGEEPVCSMRRWLQGQLHRAWMHGMHGGLLQHRPGCVHVSRLCAGHFLHNERQGCMQWMQHWEIPIPGRSERVSRLQRRQFCQHRRGQPVHCMQPWELPDGFGHHRVRTLLRWQVPEPLRGDQLRRLRDWLLRWFRRDERVHRLRDWQIRDGDRSV
jgi:hypothetical protein